MNQLSAHQFSPVYEMLGIDVQELGCIMLDTEPIVVSDVIAAADVYLKPEEPDSHTQGFVSEQTPHVTLLYGLMNHGPIIKSHVGQMLAGWPVPDEITIEEVTFFYGDPNEPNVVVVAKVQVTDELLEANARLRMLPHIDTFPEYHPHITLAYLKDSAEFESYVEQLNEKLSGQTVKVVGLNYGD
jgi:2'-5' RNA ligase